MGKDKNPAFNHLGFRTGSVSSSQNLDEQENKPPKTHDEEQSLPGYREVRKLGSNSLNRQQTQKQENSSKENTLGQNTETKAEEPPFWKKHPIATGALVGIGVVGLGPVVAPAVIAMLGTGAPMLVIAGGMAVAGAAVVGTCYALYKGCQLAAKGIKNLGNWISNKLDERRNKKNGYQQLEQNTQQTKQEHKTVKKTNTHSMRNNLAKPTHTPMQVHTPHVKKLPKNSRSDSIPI